MNGKIPCSICGTKFKPKHYRTTICSLHVTAEQIEAFRQERRAYHIRAGVRQEPDAAPMNLNIDRAVRGEREKRIVKLFVNDGLTTHEIGIIFRLTAQKIREVLRKHNIDVRDRVRNQLREIA